MRKVDVAIIGGGSAGLVAYEEVQMAGRTAVLINYGEEGTTCARVGCMPSKAFIQVAQDFSRVTRSTERGIENAEQLKINFKQLMHHVRSLRDHFVEGMLEKINKIGNNYLKGKAEFISLNKLKVNGEIIEAERIIIATGTRPYIPSEWKDFSSFFITSDNFFELSELPEAVAIIGLGSVGLETALALSQLGIKVTGFSSGELIGGLTDPQVNQIAKEIIEKEFPFILNEKINLSTEKNTLIVTCKNKQYAFEKALVAVGRRPNLDNLGLENLSLPLDSHGIPLFDPHTMKIKDAPIFLAGDVTAERAVLPQAIDEGCIAGYNASHKNTQAFKRRCDLLITFTEPTISVVGQNFSTLKNEENTVYGEARFENQGRALIMGENEGIIRVYATETGKIIGGEMVCPAGEHVAHLLGSCIQQELDVAEAIKLPFYHPVVEEGLLTALKDLLNKIYPTDKQNLCRLDLEESHKQEGPEKNCHTSTQEDALNVLALGLYTPSQSIATADLRNDSLQNIIGVLAHLKFPANKSDLIDCAQARNAEKEVFEFIMKLPDQGYNDLSSVVSASIEKKRDITPLPETYN